MDQIRGNKTTTSIRLDDYIGGQIRKRRSLLGVTQEQLAEALGLSYQQIQKYETGANRISAGRLYEISRILSTDISYFFNGIHEQDDDTPQDVSARETIELVRLFGDLKDTALRNAVRNLMRTMARSSLSSEDAGEEDSASAAVSGADGAVNGLTGTDQAQRA